jgi:hypothetical protein
MKRERTTAFPKIRLKIYLLFIRTVPIILLNYRKLKRIQIHKNTRTNGIFTKSMQTFYAMPSTLNLV